MKASAITLPMVVIRKALIELAALRAPVDEFFENVMVNAEERCPYQPPDMLSKLRELFIRVADISLLQ